MVHVKRYQNSRYWGVWIDERLLAVVCYKKGAIAIKEALINLMNGCSADQILPTKLKIEYKSQILITAVAGD